MKITMYELLGMIKDGKKLPKRVKVLDVIYEFDDHYGDYYNEELNRYLFVYMTRDEEWKLAFFLNIQVEILEEEKKIPEKLEHITIYGETISSLRNELQKTTTRFENKIKEIIDYLKSKGE